MPRKIKEEYVMKYNIRGEKIEVTPSIREYIEKKVSKIEKYLENNDEAYVHANLKVFSDGTARVELTISIKHLVIRAEESDQTMYGAIDIVVDKVERQIRKHKTKMNRKWHEKGKEELFAFPDEIYAEEEEPDLEIVRTKRVGLKPMDVDEAILQMNMLGHSFFVFNDANTDEPAIVYKRKSGKYGLIQVS